MFVFSFSEREAVEVLFSVLGTDVSRVIGPDAAMPRLMATGNDDRFDVEVESAVVATVTGVAAAVLTWATAFTVFAQSVGRGERRVPNIFMQHFVLQVRDAVVVPRGCWALAKRLGLTE